MLLLQGGLCILNFCRLLYSLVARVYTSASILLSNYYARKCADATQLREPQTISYYILLMTTQACCSCRLASTPCQQHIPDKPEPAIHCAGMLTANADDPGAPPDAGYAGGDDEARAPPPKRKLLQGNAAGAAFGAGLGPARVHGQARASSPRVGAAWL